MEHGSDDREVIVQSFPFNKMELLKAAFSADDFGNIAAGVAGAGGALGAGSYLASRALHPIQQQLNRAMIDAAGSVTQGKYLGQMANVLRSPLATQYANLSPALGRALLPGAGTQLQHNVLSAISPMYGAYYNVARLRNLLGRFGKFGLLAGGLGAGAYGLYRLLNR